MHITRSSPNWDMFIILAPLACFLKSIQKLGAERGDVFEVSVRYIRGRLALAEISNLYTCLSAPFTVNISSSFSGWAIFDIRPSLIVLLSSCTIEAIVVPSNAISLLLFVLSPYYTTNRIFIPYILIFFVTGYYSWRQV